MALIRRLLYNYRLHHIQLKDFLGYGFVFASYNVEEQLNELSSCHTERPDLSANACADLEGGILVNLFHNQFLDGWQGQN